MILYLDTSSLVKLYIEEEHSDWVHAWADQAEVLCTSRVAYPEAMAALSRRRRAGDLNKETFQTLADAFLRQWPDFVALDLDEYAAADLAVRHGLKGFDAIHLATAKAVSVEVRPTSTFFFSSFDTKLNRAARDEGLTVLDGASGARLPESPSGSSPARRT